MGSPCIFGMKYEGKFKVTYAHWGGYFIDKNNRGVFAHICEFVQRVDNDTLKQMFEQIVLEDDYDTFPQIAEEEMFINFERTDIQLKIEEFFSPQADMFCSLSDGTVHILDYECEFKMYDRYFVDLDHNEVVANVEGFGFELPIPFLRDITKEEMFEALKIIRNAHSLLSGRGDYEENYNRFHWKTYLSGKITQKGQVTIPIEVREAWKVKEGDRLEFIIDHERVVSVQPAYKKSIRDMVGILTMEEE